MAKMRKSATKMDGRRSGKTRAWSKDDHRELKRQAFSRSGCCIFRIYSLCSAQSR